MTQKELDAIILEEASEVKLYGLNPFDNFLSLGFLYMDIANAVLPGICIEIFDNWNRDKEKLENYLLNYNVETLKNLCYRQIIRVLSLNQEYCLLEVTNHFISLNPGILANASYKTEEKFVKLMNTSVTANSNSIKRVINTFENMTDRKVKAYVKPLEYAYFIDREIEHKKFPIRMDYRDILHNPVIILEGNENECMREEIKVLCHEEPNDEMELKEFLIVAHKKYIKDPDVDSIIYEESKVYKLENIYR